MKKQEIPNSLLQELLAEAKQGSGIEHELGGGNTSYEMTLLKSDLLDYPAVGHLAGKHLTLVVNVNGALIGHKVRA